MNDMQRMRVLMIGVGPETQGGMWSVVAGYLESGALKSRVDIEYVATATRVSASRLAKLKKAIRGFRKISALLKTGCFALVHIHMSERGDFFRGAISILMAKRKRLPVVLHMHGGSFKTFYGDASNLLKRLIVNVLNKADRVIVLGKVFEEFFLSLGLDASRVVVLPNAVEVPGLNDCKSDARDVLYLGVISRDKGIIDYLDAIRLLPDDVTDRRLFKLFGPLSDIDIEKEIERRHLKGTVVYGGYLSPSEKSREFGKSCLLVLPSHFEVLPMVLIEAMAYGVPVVATDVGSVSEMVEDGINGLLVKPYDSASLATALQRMLADEDMRSACGAAAYETARSRYSMDGHIKRLVEIYQSIATTR